MMAPRPLMMLRHQIELVRGLFVDVGGRMTRRTLCRAFVLAMYVVMNLGLPTGFGPHANASSAKEACRCSPESRAAGRCCCAKGGKSAAKTGCCAARAATTAKSCCAKKQKEAPLHVQPVHEDSLAWTGACPCSPADVPLMLLCSQPRILTEVNSLEIRFLGNERVPAMTAVPCGVRSRPCVPPPESAT